MREMILCKKRKGAIIQGIIILLVFILMAGCSKRGNISSATLVGYDASSFEKTMLEYFEDMRTEDVSNLSYGWKEGWEGSYAPSSKALHPDEKAMTYILTVDLIDDDETELNRMIFYMIHNTKTNTLSAHGGLFDEDGEIYPMSLSETRDGLKSIFDQYN